MTAGAGGADRGQLGADLRALPLPRGATVLVHASLSKVRPDRGAAAVVVDALLDVVGPEGTLLVPTQTTWNSTSSPHYRNAIAGMTAQQVAAYRAALPGFDLAATPSYGMGTLAEYVRTIPGSLRSPHPQTSFAAIGRRARELTAMHSVTCHLGARSPLGALFRSHGVVLHLGTEYNVSTVFHLAEYLYANLPTRTYECRIAVPRQRGGESIPDGESIANAESISEDGWISFADIPLDDSDFPQLGRDFESDIGTVRRHPVGGAEALLFPVRDAVRYAVDWMRRMRRAPW
jgi:aminoglycoside 3-N-acetyltransferase